MSAEIEIINGEPSFASIGDPPWWGVGVEGSPDWTWNEWYEACRADFMVEREPLYVKRMDVEGGGFDDIYVKLDGFYGVVRMDTMDVLDVCREDWHPDENKRAFQFLSELNATHGLLMETAGVLKDGAIVFALARRPGHIRTGLKDEFTEFVLVLISHTVGMASYAINTTVRVVCMNTLVRALNIADKGSMYRNFHTRDGFNIEAASEIVMASHAESIKRTILMSRLEQVALDPDQIDWYICQVQNPKLDVDDEFFKHRCNNDSIFAQGSPEVVDWYLKSRSRPVITSRIMNGMGTTGDTWADAVNGMSEYIDHRGTTKAETRFRSSVLDQGSRTKNRAFNLAIEYAGINPSVHASELETVI